MSQALLSVDTTDTGNLVEITVFGHPRVKSRVKGILLSLAMWLRELRDQRGELVFVNLYVEELQVIPLALRLLLSVPFLNFL